MSTEKESKGEPTYRAKIIRFNVHLDWYLLSTLGSDIDEKSWTLGEIQEKLYSFTGIKHRKSTILKRNASLFQQYQCSPLRLVDTDKYSLDHVYYKIAGDKVKPPPDGPGRPKKKYTAGEKELDNL